MNFLEKLIRADEERPTRFHTQAGEFCGWREFLNLLPSIQSWMRYRLTGHRSVVPWWTWNAIKFVEKNLRKTDRVLEAGAGYSSLWLAERCRMVQSIETNSTWSQRLRSLAAARRLNNLEIIDAKDTADVFAELMQQAVAEREPYDVVIIDSPGSRTSMLELMEILEPSKAPRVIVYDNTDRAEDRKAVKAFRTQCYEKRRFRGFLPEIVHVCETTLFLKHKDECV